MQSFPLNQDVNEISFKDSYQVPSKFRIKSEMMQEMETIEPEIFKIGKPEEMEKDEEPKLTRAEMIQRSRELRALRMRESQKSAKAHHQNKIKSKKYHRILKKEKMKQQIKEFELLQKTDPEAALRKIEQLDRSRIEERANLRHRNTGTWAKNLQVRAKYDKDVRKELADQIAISRELTAKKDIDSSDDETNESAANAQDDDYDPFNPWLTAGKAGNGKSNDVEAFLGDYRKYWAKRNQNEINLKEYGKNAASEENGNDAPLQEVTNGFITEDVDSNTITRSCKVKGSKKNAKKVGGWIVEDMEEPKSKTRVTNDSKRAKKSKKVKTVDNIDDLFDDAEDELKDRADKKFKEMQPHLADDGNEKSTKKKKRTDSENVDGEIDLSFKKQIKRAKIDEALLDDNEFASNGTDLKSRIDSMLKSKISGHSNGISNASTSNINPDDIAKVKTQNLKTALPSTIYSTEDDGYIDYDNVDYHFDDEKQLAIAQAFEDDDIVAEFQREKEDEAKKNDPQEIELSMPGWGSWSGAGIDPSKQKPKRRVILKFPAPEKRRPDNQGNVVIIENRDEKLKKHLVSTLPFPFTSVEDYEQSIRAPIGRDFVPATAHRLLTKPAVITKSGTIIEPMNENMLCKKPQRPRSKTDRKIAEIQGDDD